MKDIFNIQNLEKYTIIEIRHNKLDLFDTPNILSNVENSLKEIGFPNLILNLMSVDHIDSTGIGLLIAIQNILTKNGSTMVVTGINDKVAEIFRITKMGTFLQLFDTIEEAENHFKG